MCGYERYYRPDVTQLLGAYLRRDPNFEFPKPDFLIEKSRIQREQETRQRRLNVLVSLGTIGGIVIGAVLAATETSPELELGIGLAFASALAGSVADSVVNRRQNRVPVN